MCDRHCLTSISVEVEPISVPVAADGAVRLELTAEPTCQLEAKADSACSSAGQQFSPPSARAANAIHKHGNLRSPPHHYSAAPNAMHTPLSVFFFFFRLSWLQPFAMHLASRQGSTPPQIVSALNLSVSSHRVCICDYTRLPQSVRGEKNKSEQRDVAFNGSHTNAHMLLHNFSHTLLTTH